MEGESFSFPSLDKELWPNTDCQEKENVSFPSMSSLIGFLFNDVFSSEIYMHTNMCCVCVFMYVCECTSTFIYVYVIDIIKKKSGYQLNVELHGRCLRAEYSRDCRVERAGRCGNFTLTKIILKIMFKKKKCNVSFPFIS